MNDLGVGVADVLIPPLLQTRPPAGPGGDNSLGPVLLWLGVLIVVTLAGGAVLLWYRRRVLGEPPAGEVGSFMDELRRAKDAGEISTVEFEAAKKQMVAKIRGGLAVPPTPGNELAPSVRQRPRGAARYGFHEAADGPPGSGASEPPRQTGHSDEAEPPPH